MSSKLTCKKKSPQNWISQTRASAALCLLSPSPAVLDVHRLPQREEMSDQFSHPVGHWRSTSELRRTASTALHVSRHNSPTSDVSGIETLSSQNLRVKGRYWPTACPKRAIYPLGLRQPSPFQMLPYPLRRRPTSTPSPVSRATSSSKSFSV